MESAGRSEMGNVRKRNEDSLLLNDKYALFIVADGIGGLNDGHLASRKVVLGINSFITEALGLPEDGTWESADYRSLLHDSMLSLNAEIYSEIKSGKVKEMGAVALLVLIRKGRLFFAHAGDCKLFILRDQEIVKLNEDHTRVMEMVKQGIITPGEAEIHPRRHVITRAVGPLAEVIPDVGEFVLKENDRIIMTTDGICDDLGADGIKKIMLQTDSPDLGCEALVNLAKEGPAKDNLTIVAIDYP